MLSKSIERIAIAIATRHVLWYMRVPLCVYCIQISSVPVALAIAVPLLCNAKRCENDFFLSFLSGNKFEEYARHSTTNRNTLKRKKIETNVATTKSQMVAINHFIKWFGSVALGQIVRSRIGMWNWFFRHFIRKVSMALPMPLLCIELSPKLEIVFVAIAVRRLWKEWRTARN